MVKIYHVKINTQIATANQIKSNKATYLKGRPVYFSFGIDITLSIIFIFIHRLGTCHLIVILTVLCVSQHTTQNCHNSLILIFPTTILAYLIHMNKEFQTCFLMSTMVSCILHDIDKKKFNK